MNTLSATTNMVRPRISVARAIWFKPLVFALALVPMINLVWSIFNGAAGPNPIEYLEKSTGEWSLRFLWFSLFLTPLADIFKALWPIRIRRMIGLFAFFYVVVHFLIYMVLDQSMDFQAILTDFVERPYISAGLVALLILLPLAVTSNRYMVSKLMQRWKTLHRWVYFAAIAAILHYVWLAKGDQIEPLVYLALLLVLLGYRVQKLLR